MINIEDSRNGELTAKIDNIYVHSAYSPLKEAEKYFKTNELFKGSTFIIIGPCLNYLTRVIKKNVNSAKIYSIYLNSEFYEMDNGKSDQALFFNPQMDFFNQSINLKINETDTPGLKIIIWPPSSKLYREAVDYINKNISQKIRQLHGNITTISGFGSKMIKNYLKNFLSLSSIHIFRDDIPTVVITGSGPGLKNDVDFLKKNRKKYFLLSLPSSLIFLESYNIIPDLIITTDPGYYASLHIINSTDTTITFPLTANIPNHHRSKNILLDCDHFLDHVFLKNTPSYSIPSNGTVAGSAVLFALKYFSGPIILSGLDFSYIDCKSHIRPHTFDTLIESNSTRENPLHRIFFDRNISNSRLIGSKRRTTGALTAYSGWFNNLDRSFSNRLYFLNYYTNPPGIFSNIDFKYAERLFSDSINIQLDEYKMFTLSEKKNILSCFFKEADSLIFKLKKEISNSGSGYDIFKLLNFELAFNLITPELLEFKRHFIDNDIAKTKIRAFELIDKMNNILLGLKKYAE